MGAAPHAGGLSPPLEQTARRYAGQLLRAQGGGEQAAAAIDLADEHPALAAARCGLLALTGDADGGPELCPLPLAACADGALAALAAIAPPGALAGLRGSQLLTERAAITGHARNGAISPNGSCRLLQAGDGVLALNLPRVDDWSLLQAWLEHEVEPDWDAVAAGVAARRLDELIEQGRALGLAVADAGLFPSPASGRGWPEGPGEGSRLGPGRCPLTRRCFPSPASGRGEAAGRRPRVVDLSSLWAGPLCTHLLQRCGADVIKVESLHRPDGARGGAAAFFDLMHAGKRCAAFDFRSAAGRAQLLALLQSADIVVEASRPRALRQLGIDADALIAANPQLTWISLTGHGRAEPQAQWIAYGDDAGVAAGLSAELQRATGRWLICGDAIADPMAGLHAAFAAWAGWRRGGAGLVDLALVDVLRDCAGFELRGGTQERWRNWTQQLRASRQPVRPPQARRAPYAAAAIGADTANVMRELPAFVPASVAERAC